MADTASIKKTKHTLVAILSTLSLLTLSPNGMAQTSENGEAEYMGLTGGSPYFNVAFQNVELSGTGNKGTGIGLTVGYEVFEPTVLGSPSIALNYSFASLDNDVEYDSLALVGGFRGWGTKVYPVYGLGVARQGVKYALGENTSFNQFLYYIGLGAALGHKLSAEVRYVGTSPLGEDGSNPANDTINTISLRLGWGNFSGIARF